METLNHFKQLARRPGGASRAPLPALYNSFAACAVFLEMDK